MLVLLSSAHSARYREDILRCIAAPVGARIQFRYDKKWISENLLQRILSKRVETPCAGMVCYVDTQGTDIMTMIPVRSVSIDRINIHGRSISLILQMQAMHSANPKGFTTEVFALSGDQSPRNVNGVTEGKYMFEISSQPGTLRTGETLGDWEETVCLLREQTAFQAEPFFWIIPGIEVEGMEIDSNKLSMWPNQPLTKPFDLLIYHYQTQSSQLNSQLQVLTGPSLEPMGPSEVKVDSRYDLKHWRFHPKPKGYRPQNTWLRIRTADLWDLDLSLLVKASLTKALWKAVVAGPLIAAPAILSLVAQKDVSIKLKILIALISLVSGILAAISVILSIERID